MRINLESFRGEAPRLTPRALPENGAQAAVNARLQSGDLEAWRQFVAEKTLANLADVQTIYLLNGEWLSWTADVDVARGAIAGDNTFRTYLTGPDFYDQPRFTNFAMATSGAEPFPSVTRPLGVPNPDAAPTLIAGISTNAPAAIDALDNGDQIESWTLSPQVPGVSTVVEDPGVGNGPPSYSLTAINNSGDAAWLHRDFGLIDVSVAEISFDFLFNNETLKRMLVNFLADENGQGIFFNWSETGQINLGISTQWSSFGDSVLASGVLPAPSDGVWYTCTLGIVANDDGTKTVTATISNGSTQIGQPLVLRSSFGSANNGHVGFILHVGQIPAVEFKTHYDNISVRASLTSALQQVATSYVFTFVNDLGEESGPSPASSTILKDDGTAITVTTPTTVQSGFSVDYNVETKRIYRAVTGSTGTAFLFVAEIPLSQADYVDELTDSELGDVLESDDWELPPDDLKGILALPNGIMVGFRRNQLCFSAQNHPHAWPVKFRLNTDVDIVGIGNIDTTVVIGTKAFPYLAIGSDPSAYSMTKLEVPQACVAKRSVAYLTGIGVVFASPDGLIAVAGNGSVRNLTESVFTRRQWQALSPDSIVGVAHDDVYHFFFNTDFVDPFEFTILPHDLALEDGIEYFPGTETSAAAAAPQNQWTLIELRRDSAGLTELLVNDIVRAEQSGYMANIGDGTRVYDIGSFDNNQEFFNGFIDLVRVRENGVSKLSVDFEGPNNSTSFTDNTGALLTGQNGTFQSNTQAYDGGFSARFTGAQNIVSNRVCNVGTGAFSMSAAVYPVADVSPGQRVISAQDVISVNIVVTIRVNTGGLVQAQMRDSAGNNLLILNSSDATSGPLADISASRFTNVDLTPTPTGVPPGMVVTLTWDGFSGRVGLKGTPTTPGSYTITVTYRNTDTLETLGISTHSVVIT